MKYVHDHLHVVEHDPLARGETVQRHRSNSVVLFQAAFDLPRDRFQMRFRRARAEDEKIREARDASQIENDDVLGFFAISQFGATSC